MKHYLQLLLIVLLGLCCGIEEKKSPSPTTTPTWQEVDKGLWLIHLTAPVKSIAGDSKITVLKIDPWQYDFKLVSAKETHEKIKTAKQWAQSKKLIAVINAGMYKQDYLTNTAYMQNGTFINNPTFTKDNTVFAFSNIDSTLPPAQLIDLECQRWDSLKNKYRCFVQGIRMVDCHQHNKWQLQDKKWSMAVLGSDKKGNILFIHTRSPYRVHDMVNMLLKFPIDLYNAMYLEGGPEASFYLDHKGVKVEKFGSYETGFIENDENDHYWEIPNVIGFVKKP